MNEDTPKETPIAAWARSEYTDGDLVVDKNAFTPVVRVRWITIDTDCHTEEDS